MTRDSSTAPDDFSIPADAAGISLLLEQLERWTQARELGNRLTQHLQIVIEELAVNSITHGCCRTPDRIEVGLRFVGHDLHIEYRDQGLKFDPTTSTNSAPTHGSVGGWGLEMVRNFVERWHYERDGTTNIVTLVLVDHDS